MKISSLINPDNVTQYNEKGNNLFRPYALWKNASREYSDKVFSGTTNNGDNKLDSGLRYDFDVSRVSPTSNEITPINTTVAMLIRVS